MKKRTEHKGMAITTDDASMEMTVDFSRFFDDMELVLQRLDALEASGETEVDPMEVSKGTILHQLYLERDAKDKEREGDKES
jgi:hypothetical protein